MALPRDPAPALIWVMGAVMGATAAEAHGLTRV